MSYYARYDRGDWACLCDVCGRKMKNTDLRKRWDGLMTCSDDWEPRQPQDFVRGVADYQAPPWTRPEPANQFIPVELIYDDYGQPIMQPFFATGVPSLGLIIYSGANRLLRALVTGTVSLFKYKFRRKPINASAINRTSLG